MRPIESARAFGMASHTYMAQQRRLAMRARIVRWLMLVTIVLALIASGFGV
jgi:hypothetical protein